MKKIFNGADVVMDAIVIKSEPLSSAKEVKEIKDWRKRTFFLVNGKVHWSTDDKQWRDLLATDITDIKTCDTTEVEDKQYPFGLCITTKETLFVKNFYCGFKTNDTRIMWLTALRALGSQNQYIRQFVNPGIGIIHICLLYKGIFKQEHFKWSEILSNQQQYAKDFRKLDVQSVSPLHIAAFFDFVQETNMILQNSGYLNTQTDFEKYTPLHFCLVNISNMNQCLSFETLIHHSAKIDIPNQDNLTVMDIVSQNFVGSKLEAILDQNNYISLDIYKWT